MQTPAGKECPHYYADFHRGHSRQECRLVGQNPESTPWLPSDCFRCPVPDIRQANASPDLLLRLTIRPVILGLGRRMVVEASCQKHLNTVDDPYVGCPQCNAERPGVEAFIRALEEESDD